MVLLLRVQVWSTNVNIMATMSSYHLIPTQSCSRSDVAQLNVQILHFLERIVVAIIQPHHLRLQIHNLTFTSFKSIYRVLTLMAHTYTELLLNDGSAPDGRYLCRVTPE